jgi:hypothetical protein
MSQAKRLELISDCNPLEQCTPEEIIDTSGFMLSLKARYPARRGSVE